MAENAAFFWMLYSQGENRRDYNQSDLDELSQKINAQLAGLEVYGEEAWVVCDDILDFEDSGEVFVAASVILGSRFDERDKSERMRKVVTAACAGDESFDGLVGAFKWRPFDESKSWIAKFLKSGNPVFSSLGVDICAAQDRDCGAMLTTLIEKKEVQENPDYFWRIVKAVGELRRKDLIESLLDFINAEDDRVRFWSAWSCVLLGDLRGLESLKIFAKGDSFFSERALKLILRVMPAQDAKHFVKELAAGDSSRAVILSAGILGEISAIPWLLQQMQEKITARLAGESFSLITGLEILNSEYETEAPADLPILEETSDMDSRDDDLPWPNANSIATWYQLNRLRFSADQRYLLGQIVSMASCEKIKQTGYQPQRKAADLEIIAAAI